MEPVRHALESMVLEGLEALGIRVEGPYGVWEESGSSAGGFIGGTE